jgi:glycosyltransferase involved in cell wall biosynthesis
MKPLISIAIPVFNAESTIDLAIKSVLLQEYSNWELLIIDDGSSDQSMDIARRYDDPRIKLMSDGTNLGLISRLNTIPSLSRGEYLARMDADDIMHPKRLISQLHFMETNPEVDVIDCAIYSIDENNIITGIRNQNELTLERTDLIKNCLFTHPAVFGKRHWFEINLYDHNYYRAEDYELWIRTFPHTRFGRVKEPLLFYREGNVSISNYKNSMKTVRNIIRNYSPGLIPNFTRNVMLIKSYAKQFIYVVFGFLNLQRLLVARRSKSVTEQAAQKIINNIISYKS